MLADGTRFNGKAIGKTGTTTGEIAFNTGMYGYQEIFTDPSYVGQVLVMATAHIGNYGVNPDEVESQNIKISGLVVKKFSEVFSRPAASGSLQELLERDGITGISDVDTRALVRHIREKGAMNCVISSDVSDPEQLMAILASVPSMEGLELSSRVSAPEVYVEGVEGGLRIALLDFGVKRNIIRCLTDRGCLVKVFPMKSGFEEILAWQPAGIMLSNGPGDPGAMTEETTLISRLVQTGLPIFGICLGHQLLALSQGLRTVKMFNGHRGVNHPVKNLLTGRCEITSQNHGFVVSEESLRQAQNIELTHVHLNDSTVAGIRLKDKPAFSVQYHPEASAGPHDSRYLFDEFVGMASSHQNTL